MIRLSVEQGSWLEGILRGMEGAEPRLLADQILDQLQHDRGTGGQVIDRVYALLSYGLGRNHVTRDVMDGLRKAILSPSELRQFEAKLKNKFACSECGRQIQPGEAVTYMPNSKEQGVVCVNCVLPSVIACPKCKQPKDINKAFQRLIGRVKLTCECKEKTISQIAAEAQAARGAAQEDPFGGRPGRVVTRDDGSLEVVSSANGAFPPDLAQPADNVRSFRATGRIDPAPPQTAGIRESIPVDPTRRMPWETASEWRDRQMRQDAARGVRPIQTSPWSSLREQQAAIDEQRRLNAEMQAADELRRQMRSMQNAAPTFQSGQFIGGFENGQGMGALGGTSAAGVGQTATVTTTSSGTGSINIGDSLRAAVNPAGNSGANGS